MLKITIRDAGRVRILDLRGRINHGEGDLILRDAVSRLVTEGQGNIVLNMKGVEWIDTSGLGELVACHLRTKRIKGKISLVMPNKLVEDIIVAVNLNKIFEIYDDEVKAVGSF